MPPPYPPKSFDLDITIVSAKHLHNCNWRLGDLKPYVSFWIETGRRFTTKPDEDGSTKPVWNERFVVPINVSIFDSLLSIEINHSGDSSSPVGSLQFPLKELINSNDSRPIRTLELLRPSGRPQGKLRVKLSLRERERERERPSPPPPDYHIAPPPTNYYTTAPPPSAHTSPAWLSSSHFTPRSSPGPLPSQFPPHSSPAPMASHFPPLPAHPPPPVQPPASPYPYSSYSDPYSGYYSSYYSQLPPPPRPSFFDQGSSYGSHSGPSAPIDNSSYDQRGRGSKMGLGTGLAVGAVAGALGGLALEEGLKHEEEKIAERVESDLDARDNYSDYRVSY